jgi:hypothetical protein
MALGEAYPHILDTTRFADDLDIHRGATDFAVLDGGVVPLRCIGGGRDDFPTVRALNLDLDEHDSILESQGG